MQAGTVPFLYDALCGAAVSLRMEAVARREWEKKELKYVDGPQTKLYYFFRWKRENVKRRFEEYCRLSRTTLIVSNAPRRFL